MQYSREVENMVCVKKGATHDPAPIPEEGKWVKADHRHQRLYPRCWLVCSSAGRLQALFEH